jgi:Family of unknown function (DUF5996)
MLRIPRLRRRSLPAGGSRAPVHSFTMIPEPEWPPLPLDAWADTYATLHMWMQVVGKVRLALAPRTNHWWHVALYLTARGLTTSPIPYRDWFFEIRFDFIDHQLVIETSQGDRRSIALVPQSVADFHQGVMRALGDLGIVVDGTANASPVLSEDATAWRTANPLDIPTHDDVSAPSPTAPDISRHGRACPAAALAARVCARATHSPAPAPRFCASATRLCARAIPAPAPATRFCARALLSPARTTRSPAPLMSVPCSHDSIPCSEDVTPLLARLGPLLERRRSPARTT